MFKRAHLVSSTLLLFAAFVMTSAQAAATKEGHERSATMSAKVPISQAIQDVEKRNNGKAVAAQMEYSDGKAFYEITTVQADQRTLSTVDPQTGNITNAAKKVGSARKHDDMAVAGALSRAVMTAEKSEVTSKALSAEYLDRNDVARIRVRLVRSGDRIQDIDVDPATGKVVKVGEIEHLPS